MAGEGVRQDILISERQALSPDVVSLSGKQLAELNGMATEEWSDDTRHEMPLKQFLTVVDFLGENAPVWAWEIAFARDGAKKA